VKRKPFGRVAAVLHGDPRSTPTHQAVYAALTSCLDARKDNGTVRRRWVAQRAHRSERQVSRILGDLVAWGYVTRSRPRAGVPFDYAVNEVDDRPALVENPVQRELPFDETLGTWVSRGSGHGRPDRTEPLTEKGSSTAARERAGDNPRRVTLGELLDLAPPEPRAAIVRFVEGLAS
jgi:hypothetical protein